jgi:hypothetical protein
MRGHWPLSWTALHLFFFSSDVDAARSLTNKLAIVPSDFSILRVIAIAGLLGCWVVVFLDYEICDLGHRK